MIPGIVAQMPVGGGGGPGPGSGTVLDFVAGTYTVDGTSYAITDLLEQGVQGNGTTPLGDPFDPGAVIAGRGLLISSDIDAMQPRAKGALATKLMAAYTAIIEFEDIGEYFGSFMGYVESDGTSRGFIWQSGYTTLLDFDPPGTQKQTGSSATYRFAGGNKIAFTVGTTTMHVSQNGQALVGAAVDGGAFITIRSYAQVFPFGSAFGNGQCDVIVRRLTILPPAVPADLPALSALTTPGPITDLSLASVTSTTVTLAFTAVSGATGYEYLALPSGGWPDGMTVEDWTALPGDKTVTGLMPSTAYRIYVRTVGADGPGRADSSYGVNATTTA